MSIQWANTSGSYLTGISQSLKLSGIAAYRRVTCTIFPHRGARSFKGEFVYAAVRPHAAAGIALLGAGVIAVSPLAPPMPHIQAVERAVSSARVELDAMVNPIEQ